MYFIYALYNRQHNKIYIGQSENLDIRVILHNEKKFKKSYTARFDGEWTVIYTEPVENKKKL